MTCTNDHFQLERDIPGVFVSFKVPSNVIQKSFEKQETVEVNYKRLFRRLTGRKKSSTIDIKQTTSNNDPGPTTSSDPLSNVKTNHSSSNRFDTLIDRLERKYLALSNVQSSVEMVLGSEGEDSMSSSQVSTSNQSSPDVQEKTVGGDLKRKKKKAVIQDYDYSDPFIDDSEVVNELEEALTTKKLKTKHDGFFVSSGELEVVKVKKVAKTPLNISSASTTLFQTPAPSSSSSSTTAVNNPTTISTQVSSVISSDIPKSTKVSKTNKVSISTDITTPTNTATHSTPVTPTTALSQAMSTSMEEEDPSSSSKPKKEKVEKPAWTPHPDVTIALEKFKDLLTETYSTTWTKHLTFPPALDQPLLQLDAVVKQHHDEKELARTSGYYEALQSYIGRGYTASKIKTMIQRLQIKEKAKAAKIRLDQSIATLQEQLKASIIDCPPEKQPANKKPRKPKDSAIATNPPETAMEVSEALNESTDAPNVSVISETPEMAQGEKDDEGNNNKISNGGEEKKNLVEYKFYCPWNISLRQQLLQIEVLVEEWVNHENSYREKLFAADRKYMHSSEVMEINNVSFVTNLISVCLLLSVQDLGCSG